MVVVDVVDAVVAVMKRTGRSGLDGWTWTGTGTGRGRARVRVTVGELHSPAESAGLRPTRLESTPPAPLSQRTTISPHPSLSPAMPAPFPSHVQQHPLPALYLYPLNDSFIPKHIHLPQGQRIKIGRQTNAKTAPGERNGFFDSKVLSRQHAEVWEESGKVRPYPRSPALSLPSTSL